MPGTSGRRPRTAPLVLAACGLLAASIPAAAQSPRSRPAPDFFFEPPRGSATVRGSWLFARAGSDLFDFVTEQLTVEKRDFNTPAFGLDLNIALTPRLEVVASLDVSRAKQASEYRDFVDNDFLPIQQETMLNETNVSGGVRFWLTPRGRRVSRFVWVPRALTPYVGAGAGAMRYEFRQTGDFVDFLDLSVFPASFASQGWTPSAHVFGGAELQPWKRLCVSVEARYLWADAPLGRDFVDFDQIDLAGLRISGGVGVQF